MTPLLCLLAPPGGNEGLIPGKTANASLLCLCQMGGIRVLMSRWWEVPAFRFLPTCGEAGWVSFLLLKWSAVLILQLSSSTGYIAGTKLVR